MKRNVSIIVFIALAIAVIITAMAGCRRNETSLYPLMGEIVGINEELDIVTFSTTTGNKFSFYGVEDYEEGDWVAVIMDDNGTEIVYDDKVMMVHYQGR